MCFLQKYAFNKYVSDKINVKREMPDTRHADCRKIDYDRPETLPKTSVILIFCNEALSVLLRYFIGTCTTDSVLIAHSAAPGSILGGQKT